jgi:hypothetical protein
VGLLIPCSKELVGSNPTPRVSNVGSKVNIIRIGDDASAEKGKDKSMKLQESQITFVDGKEQLINKVDQITNSLSRPYFRKILKKLALNHEEGATAIIL